MAILINTIVSKFFHQKIYLLNIKYFMYYKVAIGFKSKVVNYSVVN